MRWVDQAMTRPHRCAVVPYVGNGRGNAFIDTGQDLDLEHVYISDVAAEHIAGVMLGWVPPRVVADKDARIAQLEADVAARDELLAEADQFADAIDGLTKRGMVVRKQPGRKPKKKEEEVGV